MRVLHYISIVIYSIALCRSYRTFNTRPLRPSISLKSDNEAYHNALAPHWTNGLKFECTGCGRCCLNEGSVWMDIHEFASVCDSLKLPVEDVVSAYVKRVVGIGEGWVEINSKVLSVAQQGQAKSVEGCVFLSDSDGKSCTIYSDRPIQCRTYPYWSNLMTSKKLWDDERVVKDGEDGKQWSPESGGCEGISDATTSTSPLVPPQYIHAQLQLYDWYRGRFPPVLLEATSGVENEKERKKFFQKVQIIQKVRLATSKWIDRFVVQHNLCPFAKNTMTNKKARVTVVLPKTNLVNGVSSSGVGGMDGYEDVIDALRGEVRFLMAHSNEEVETSLLVLPCHLPKFQDFYAFSLKLQNEVLPALLREVRLPTTATSTSSSTSSSSGVVKDINSEKKKEEDEEEEQDELSTTSTTTSSNNSNSDRKGGFLASRLKKKKTSSSRVLDGVMRGQGGGITASMGSLISNTNQVEDELQLAVFHPLWQWTTGDMALAYEKRAPFPVLNLLRTAAIKAAGGGVATATIAQRNRESLEKEGSESLRLEMEAIWKEMWA